MGAGSMIQLEDTSSSATSVALYPTELTWTNKKDLVAISRYISESNRDTRVPETTIFDSKRQFERFKLIGTIDAGSPTSYTQVDNLRTLTRSGYLIWLTWDELKMLSTETAKDGTQFIKPGSVLTTCEDWIISKRGDMGSYKWDYAIDLLVGKERA